MKKYLFILLGIFVLSTTVYAQELTEKEKQDKKRGGQTRKENAKKEVNLKKQQRSRLKMLNAVLIMKHS